MFILCAFIKSLCVYGCGYVDVYFQVSVYAVPDKKDQVKYALDTAAKLLEFYNEFFGIHYPLNKLGGCIRIQLLWRVSVGGTTTMLIIHM